MAGGIAGTLVMVGWFLSVDTIYVLSDLRALFFGAGLGAVVGAVLGPSAAWLLMRHVPLGVAIGGTALGTLAGAVIGLVAFGQTESLSGALLGFAAAAVLLRARTPRDGWRVAVPAEPRG